MSNQRLFSPLHTRIAFNAVLIALMAGPTAAQTLNFQQGDALAISYGGTSGEYQGRSYHTSQTSFQNNGYTTLGDSDGANMMTSTSLDLWSGSSIYGNIGVYDAGGLLSVNGGTISSNFTHGTGVWVYGSSGVAVISSGSISAVTSLEADGGGFIYLMGGAVSGNLDVGNQGVIDLFGTFNGFSSGTHFITSGSGTLSGTLQDGEKINVPYAVYQGTLEINAGARQSGPCNPIPSCLPVPPLQTKVRRTFLAKPLPALG